MSSVDRLLEMSVELAKAHLAGSPMEADKINGLVEDIYRNLKRLAAGDSTSGTEAAPSSTSVSPATHVGRRDAPPIISSDISGPEFEGIDPWLAARIQRRVARKLNKDWKIHPTVFPDHLVCLEDGESVKLLRAYLRKRFDLSFADYLDRWNLPDDYPVAPPDYLAAKREMAKAAGLGVTTRGARGPAKKRAAPVRKAKAEA